MNPKVFSAFLNVSDKFFYLPGFQQNCQAQGMGKTCHYVLLGVWVDPKTNWNKKQCLFFSDGNWDTRALFHI